METFIEMEEFMNPPAEYRGMPFWAWNTKLNPDVLSQQIQAFKEMGMGGFYLHTRVGLDTEYLGPEFMDNVKQCVELAGSEGMRCGLYDEDRWPSGYGGGYVTKNPDYRCKCLLLTPYRQGTKEYGPPVYDSRAAFAPQGNGVFMAAYKVKLGQDGTLVDYVRCGEDGGPVRPEDFRPDVFRPDAPITEDFTPDIPDGHGYTTWYAYLETAHDSPWFNNQAYVDTMNEDAVQCFIRTAYEAYDRQVGEQFGKTIPSIFTDEPQFAPKGCLGDAFAKQEIMLPFTGDFADTYKHTYGEDLFDHLPELLWELPHGQVSVSRYRYHDHAAMRFASAYSGQIGKWCEDHNIRLAGHMMEEPTLHSQTRALGEVMRSLRGFSLPGIDMLCDAREYTTAKQAESICHQYGKAGMVSELYGVTNWDFDFRRHKLQGDWQAALGVTERVHHLSWMSMNGEAKRDYPASIGFQSPWYKKYALVEDHFARVNVMMKKGIPVVRVGVIHPVESCWISYGPAKQTSMRRQELDEQFAQVTEWLLFDTLDFDYISESLIPELWKDGCVGRMKYDAVVVPGCVTLRSTTLAMLDEFKNGGGKVIFMGDIPGYVDAVRSEKPEQFAATCSRIPFSRTALSRELDAYRLVDIRYYGEKHLKKPNHKKNWDGERAEKYICQLRQDGEDRILFIANGKPLANADLVIPDRLEIRLAGAWDLEVFDTVNGAVRPLPGTVTDGDTIVHCTMYEQDSLLLRMRPAGSGLRGMDAGRENGADVGQESGLDAGRERGVVAGRESGNAGELNLFRYPVSVTREEPNVLLLDLAEYSFDGQIWNETEEILRIDNLYREKLGYPLRMAAQAQPWTVKEKDLVSHDLFLRYHVDCESDIKGAMLALEEADATDIFLDGILVSKEKNGYYVDLCITRILLPDLKAGGHELCLKLAFTAKTNVEYCFLLGDFSVRKSGIGWSLSAVREPGGWCSLTGLGMPFYGGNAVYRTEVFLEPGIYEVQVSKFRAPVIQVSVDGKIVGNIAFSPYKVKFTVAEGGVHCLEFTAFGNRVNTFGAVHDCDENEVYFDPNAWRTVQESWSYEYQLKPVGILKAPVIVKLERE